MLYVYKIIKENIVTGQQIGKPVTLEMGKSLTVGGLYAHLSRAGKGFWRVLELVSKLDVESE